MGVLSRLMISQDWVYLLVMLLNVLPCLGIVTIYGRTCSKKAYHFGEPSPKLNGRNSWNPLAHTEIIGLLLFVTTGLGWCKPLPIRQQHLEKPREKSILILGTAVGKCLLVCVGSVVLASCGYHIFSESGFMPYFVWFFLNLGVLSCGFSLSQLLPLPFFGLYQLFAPCLPDKAREKVVKYQRHVCVVMIVVLWSGFAQGVITTVVGFFLKPLCILLNFPFAFIEYYFF